jgi:mono/diheme cytochrome c family protein
MRGALLFVLLFTFSRSYSQEIEIVTPAGAKKIKLSKMKSELKSQTVEVDDIVYHKKMQYDGFRLLDVLQMAGLGADQSADELLLTAADGYTPSVRFDKVKSHSGYLVYQEKGKVRKFSPLPHGKSAIDPGPFYVVWEKSNDVSELPWAFQLIKLEAVDWNKRYANVIPPKVSKDSAEMKGFLIFKTDCLRCHSINLQGGEIGPELNAPKNVTEYWTKENLREYIPDASRFRYKSKMPPFPNLKSADLDALLSYLTHMKKFKVAGPKP